MAGAMIYQGMPGVVAATRNPVSVVPEAQVEVPAAAVPVSKAHPAAGAPGGFAAIMV